MSVSSDNNKNRYQGNGVTTAFAFVGRIFSTADLKVDIITRATDVVVETLTLTTHYTVTINGPESATVTITAPAKIPSASQDILIRRDLAQTQTVDLPTGTRFPAVAVENALDKTTALVQDLSEKIDRTLQVPVSFSGTVPGIGDLTTDEVVIFDGTNFVTTGVSGDDLANVGTNAAVAVAAAAAAEAAATELEGAAEAAKAVAIPFIVDISTTMADPGVGEIRFNSASLASVTAIAVDATSADTGNPDVSDFIASWAASTNAAKGTLFLRKGGSPSTFAAFTVTGVTDSGGWLQLAVTYVDHNGAFATAGETAYLQFSRAGDRGADGGGAGTVTSVATTLPIAGGTIIGSGTISLNINGTTGATLAAGDEIVFGDVSAANVIRKATIADVLALAGNGTIATQNANAVNITGGTITGITDLTVADGGTGASSITANSIILGNGTSALDGNLVAPGTSGNVLTSNGTTWVSSAPSGGNTFITGSLGANPTTLTTAITSSINRIVVSLYNTDNDVDGLRLGDSGGIETTGYDTITSLNNGVPVHTGTIGFETLNGTNGVEIAVFTLQRIGTTNTWGCTWHAIDNGNQLVYGVGHKTTSAATDRIAVYGTGTMTGTFSVSLLTV